MRTHPIPLSTMLLLGGGCLVASPPTGDAPASTGEVRPEAPSAEPLKTTFTGGATRDPAQRHPALGSPEDQPLIGCRELPIDNTIAWTCGPDRVLLVQHEGAIPQRASDEFVNYRGGEPTVETHTVALGDRTVQARLVVNPRLDDGPLTFTVIAEDPKTSRVATCAPLLAEGDPEDALRSWCLRAVAAALQAPD